MLSPYLTGDYGDTLSLQFLLYGIVSHLFHCHADKYKQTRLRQKRLRLHLSTVVTMYVLDKRVFKSLLWKLFEPGFRRGSKPGSRMIADFIESGSDRELQ